MAKKRKPTPARRPPRAATTKPTKSRTPSPKRSSSLPLVGVAVLAAVVFIAFISRTKDSKPTSRTSSPQSVAFVGLDFHSLVADPLKPGHLFAGGHEGVSQSLDGGRTWTRVRALNNADAMGWGFDARSMYVSGHPGLNRSTNGGATFQRMNDGLPDSDVHAFGASATTLYAAGPANGVIASRDGGTRWTVQTREAGQSFFGRILIGADDDHLVAADAQYGAVASANGGRTWRQLGGPSSALWVSRTGPTIYASGPDGAAQTSDEGAHWSALKLPPGATLVEADPADAKHLYTGALTGTTVRVWTSNDGGVRWHRPTAAATSNPFAAAYRGVCDARAVAATPAAARTTFFDRVHQPLHELATAASTNDRAAAARLLEAKEAVEHDFDQPSDALAGDLDQLASATQRAIVAAGHPQPPTCSEQP